MAPLTEGSTQAVVLMVTHAGITKTERYTFKIANPAADRTAALTTSFCRQSIILAPRRCR
jgi:hypothetical protein